MVKTILLPLEIVGVTVFAFGILLAFIGLSEWDLWLWMIWGGGISWALCWAWRSNPYLPGLVVHGDGARILGALDQIFIHEGQVFEGSVKDHLEWATQVGARTHLVRIGFQELAKELWITLSGDHFTPGQYLLGRYNGKIVDHSPQ